MEHIKSQENNLSQTVRWYIFLFSALLVLSGLFCTPQLDAGVYEWVDENGVKNYSNKSPVNAGDFKMVFDEYQHDEAEHQKRVKADQERIDALSEEIQKEEQQAEAEEQEKLEEAKLNQPQLSASECFGPSYGIQQGRTIYERIIPTYIDEGEYLDLQKLFQGLEGDWSGNGLVLSCTKTEGEVHAQMNNYSIKSVGKMYRTGEFVLESVLQSKEKWTTKDIILRLYLSEKILAQKPKLTASDIELISVSSDELVYVSKRKSRPVGGAGNFLEKVNTIKKTGEASFSLERIVYLNGRLRSKSSWHLERG